MTANSSSLTDAQLWAIIRRYAPVAPDYITGSVGESGVKTAAASSEDFRGDGLLFADPIRRRYDCSSPVSTWVSYAQFLSQDQTRMKKEAAQRIDATFQQHGRFHRISADLAKLRDAVQNDQPIPLEKLADDQFAICDSAYGRHLPIRNPQEVCAAAQYLQQYATEIPYTIKRAAAIKLLDSPHHQQLNEQQVVQLARLAGYGTGPVKVAAQLINSRSRLGKAPSALRTSLAKLAQQITTRPTMSRELRVKIAASIDAFDREAGLLVERRAGRLRHPEDILFPLTRPEITKFARTHLGLPTGEIYPIEALGHLKMADLREVIGPEIAETMTDTGLHVDMQKAAQAVTKLPFADSQLLAKLLKEAGVQPVARLRQPIGYTDQQMRSLARSGSAEAFNE